MQILVKILAGTTAVCITFLAFTALYVIWSPTLPTSRLLFRCCATSGLVAVVCAVMLSLCDTMTRHATKQDRGVDSEVEK